jgi:hypothetical protein
MKITVMGVLVVIAGVLLLGLIVYAVRQGKDETGQNNNEQPINPS